MSDVETQFKTFCLFLPWSPVKIKLVNRLWTWQRCSMTEPHWQITWREIVVTDLLWLEFLFPVLVQENILLFDTEMNFFSEWKLHVSHRKESVTGSGPNHRFCITTVSLWLVLMAKPSHVLNWTLSSKNKIMLFCTSCPTYLLNIYLSSPELTVSRVPRPKIIFCAFPFTLWLIAE